MFGREAKLHGTPLQIKTAWKTNKDEMRELKRFYDDCELKFCVKIQIQEETLKKPVRGLIQSPRCEVLFLAINIVLAKE